jgi:hypothetical protein
MNADLLAIAQRGVPTFGLVDGHARAPEFDADAARIKALSEAQQDMAVTLLRPAKACIDALPGWVFDEKTCAHLLAYLSQRIASSNWSHTEAAGITQQALDDTSDYLNELERA